MNPPWGSFSRMSNFCSKMSDFVTTGFSTGLKGMIGELVAKKNFLFDRLKKFPLLVDVKKEIISVEERIMALIMSVEFIEKWPETCNGSCVKNSKKCKNGNECPHWNTLDS